MRSALLMEGRKPYWRQWQADFRKTPEGKLHVRAMNLKKYGITPEEYDEMAATQDNVCASCGLPETANNQHGPLPLAVDHDHETGKVRGLLCMRCNRCLGMLGDNAERIEKLAAYKRRFECDL